MASATGYLRLIKNSGRSLAVKAGKGVVYKDEGVDIDANIKLVKRISKTAPGIDGPGGHFPFGDSYLIANTDRVGTKMKIAFILHTDTIKVVFRL